MSSEARSRTATLLLIASLVACGGQEPQRPEAPSAKPPPPKQPNAKRLMSHKSQLAGFIIDCQTDDLDQATEFWAEALGIESEVFVDPEESSYRGLKTRPEEIHIEVQKVDHPSRLHLDIETDNIEAEVARLEKLGAKRITEIRRWVVMEAPTGQRFCVVLPQRSNFEENANNWD